MKALILAAEGFEDSELYYPYYRLLEEGHRVDVAAPKKGALTGKHGYEFKAGKTIGDLKARDYDLLVIPGGKAPETVRLEKKAVALVKKMMEAGKPVAAICHGAQVLVSAGVLDGRRMTCYKAVRDDVKAAGAKYVDKEVVVDGNLVTSRKPSDLPAFCREMFKLMS